MRLHRSANTSPTIRNRDADQDDQSHEGRANAAADHSPIGHGTGIESQRRETARNARRIDRPSDLAMKKPNAKARCMAKRQRMIGRTTSFGSCTVQSWYSTRPGGDQAPRLARANCWAISPPMATKAGSPRLVQDAQRRGQRMPVDDRGDHEVELHRGSTYDRPYPNGPRRPASRLPRRAGNTGRRPSTRSSSPPQARPSVIEGSPQT